MISIAAGVDLQPGYLSLHQQRELIDAAREVIRIAPLFVPAMPKTGKKMSVRMSNCGPLGWVTDKIDGYRYQPVHPQTGKKWPDIPQILISAWDDLANYPLPPEACLINFYSSNARMGMHQDRDEKNLEAPVVSLSLGDDCLFRIGGTKRGGPSKSLRLKSGDALVLHGPARLAFHGVDKIYPDTSTLLTNGGRINFTLRRVNE